MSEKNKGPVLDHILIVGFGGPEKKEDVIPFIKNVAHGRNIPEHRLKEVEHHYELIGGSSPYNTEVREIVEGLEKALKEAGMDLPVFTGMRNWDPYLKETLETIRDAGLTQGLAVILAPHRSESSCGRYKQDLTRAREAAGAHLVQYRFLEPWHNDGEFIRLHADLLDKTLQLAGEKETARVLFTAHSIPLRMMEECSHCAYDREFEETSRLTAATAGLSEWEMAYQSRSGSPRDPWLEPDAEKRVQELAQNGYKKVIIDPVGFLVENAEVLFDLDIEVRQAAEKSGLQYYRVPTVNAHPGFAAMLAGLIMKCGKAEVVTCE